MEQQNFNNIKLKRKPIQSLEMLFQRDTLSFFSSMYSTTKLLCYSIGYFQVFLIESLFILNYCTRPDFWYIPHSFTSVLCKWFLKQIFKRLILALTKITRNSYIIYKLKMTYISSDFLQQHFPFCTS